VLVDAIAPDVLGNGGAGSGVDWLALGALLAGALLAFLLLACMQWSWWRSRATWCPRLLTGHELLEYEPSEARPCCPSIVMVILPAPLIASDCL